ncbi:MAG: thioredoxin domain-containing protein, partial [Gammaproteobacteria bacterium]|nr:thioredoxin domain-containing protein [Gammaproteobacteria bacterium]
MGVTAPLMCRLLLQLLLLLALPCLSPAAEQQNTGGWRLATESSPYLQLHVDNPVTWYPWGAAAFAKARRENKPVFISIGYFTCHWCHVMARESFSNPEIARQLNDNFIAIKIDREQRPDLDAAYMQYVVLTRGQGGWPMSVWATPDGEPFFGGTYFPPDASLGRPGMKQLLARVSGLWVEDEDGIRASAKHAVELLRKTAGSATPLDKLTEQPLAEARGEYAAAYDELQGGFSPAPKFPQPARLMFLLQDEGQQGADMALFTLERMIDGGIYDQLGGGFHRYSTDFEWRVPHFEKMLYDQALIARAGLFAWRRSGDKKYAENARQVLDFTLREMRAEEGGFYSALGADSPVPGKQGGHMEEGVYYTWTLRQLDDAIKDDLLRDWAAARYGVGERGNALSDPLGEMAGRNVLYRALDNRALAEKFKTDLITANRRNAEVQQRLLTARNRRPSVPVDDKVVTVWNGYMITTLALAGRLLDEPQYIRAAEQTARFVLIALYDEKQGVLYRDWRKGVRGVPAFSEDYAAVAEGLLALYKVTAEKRWLAAAIRLVDYMLLNFWDEADGGFFSTPSDTELWIRKKEITDGASLSANGVSLHVLHTLGELTGDAKYQQLAAETAAWAGA